MASEGGRSETIKFQACCGWTRWVLQKVGLGEVIPASRCSGRAFVALRSVLLVALMFTFLIAVVGLKRFKGTLQQRCVAIVPKANHTHGRTVLEEEFFQHENLWTFCGTTAGAKQCDAGQECKSEAAENPNYGYTNFDSFGYSYFSSVRLATYDFWESVYFMVILTKGYWSVPFFVVLISLTPCVLGLWIAVIMKAFTQECPDLEPEASLSTEEKPSKMEEVQQHPPASRVNSREIPKGPIGRCTDWLCIWDCCNCWTTFTQGLSRIVFNPYTDILVLVLLLCNIVNMCSDHDNIDVEVMYIARHINLSLVILFILEAFLKIIALSPKGYFSDGWQRFEFFLAVTSFIEVGMEELGGVSFLITLRVFRILRLGKYWPTLNVMMISMGKTFSIQFQFMLIFGLFLSFLAWIGTELFAKAYVLYQNSGDGLPRWNFLDQMHSFMVVFRMVCGEWVETLFDCLLVNGWSCLPYTGFVVLFGKYLLANVFLVFLLWAMRSPSSSNNNNKESETISRLSQAVDQIFECFRGIKSRFCPSYDENRLREDETVTLSFHEDLEGVVPKPGGADNLDSIASSKSVLLEYPPDCCFDDHCAICIPSNGAPASWKSFRGLCLTVVQSFIFDIIVLTVVIIGCIPLILREYSFVVGTPAVKYLDTLEVVVIVGFLVEMIIKLLAYGWSHFCRSGWRTAELVIVLVVFVNMLTLREKETSYKVLQSFQVLRLFRILKYFIRFDSFRKVLNSLLLSFPAVINAIIIVSVWWILYANWGIQLFVGTFYNCVDEKGERVNYTYVPDKIACLEKNLSWVNEDLSFDNIFQSSIGLFQVFTIKGWIGLIHLSTDSTSYEQQHIQEANIYMFFYFVLFIAQVGFYTCALILSIILDSFNRQDKLLGDSRNLNKGDAVYGRALENIRHKCITVSQRPNGSFKQFLWKMVPSGKFQVFVALCILASLVVMAGDAVKNSTTTTSALNASYITLLVILVWEIVIRFLASSNVLAFFRSSLNVLDLVTMILTLVDVSSNESVSSNIFPPMLLRLPRLFQIYFEQSWSKRFLGIRRISLTLSRSIPQVLSIYFLMAMIILVYSISGVAIFSYIEPQIDEYNFVNFEGLGNALALMFQLTTLAGWDNYFMSLRKEKEDCDAYFANSCGNAIFAPLYLMSFMIISCILSFSILVVFIKNYQASCNDIRLGIAPDDSEDFYKKWLQYDMPGQGFINYKDLSSFLDSLTGSLRVAKPNAQVVALMDLPIYSGQHVYHKEVLASLTRQQIVKQGLKVNVEETVVSFSEVGYEAVSSTLWRAHEEKCVKVIEDSWSRYKLRKISKG